MIVNTEGKIPDEAALGSAVQPAQHCQMCKWSILESEGGGLTAKTSPKTEDFNANQRRYSSFYEKLT